MSIPGTAAVKPRRINTAIPPRRGGHEARTQGEFAIFDVRSGMEVSYPDIMISGWYATAIFRVK